MQDKDVSLGLTFLDGTSIRAHHKAAGARKMGARRRNAMRVKRLAASGAATAPRLLVIADGQGRAMAFRLAPSQAHELPHAAPLLDALPRVPKWVVADRGYASHAFRQHIFDRGARPAIPSKSNEDQVACPDYIYNNRNQVERLWARLKEWRAVGTRYKKTARSFSGVLHLAAAWDWSKP